MNILFVSRRKQSTTISPIVYSQGESLKDIVSLSYLLIEGKGFIGYLNGIFKIRSFVRRHDIDLIHAHYSYTGMASALSFSKPVVCSLMGSDIQSGIFIRVIIKMFYFFFWKATIVKSLRMKTRAGLKDAQIIPNGVDIDAFKPRDLHKAREKIKFNPNTKHIVFIADKSRDEKNFLLADEAVRLVKKNRNAELHIISKVPHTEIPDYLSAADVLLLTSLWEGSPNVIKEAMACNCPIISTDVGDVEEVVGDTEGCYISSFDPEDVAEKLKKALNFGKRTNGREKIKQLDNKIIARKLLEIYKSVLKNQ